MIKIILILFLTAFVGSEARYLSFGQVHRMPKGVEKNYYIWRFITQRETTRAEAIKIIKEASRINRTLKRAYKKKTGLNPPKVSGGGIYQTGGRKATTDRNLGRKRVITTKILKSPNPLMKWLSYPPDIQVFSFNHAGRLGRIRLDHTPTISQWQRLTRERGIDRFIKYVKKERLKGFKKALFFPPSKNSRIGYSTLMSLGFLNLQRNSKKVSEYDFYLASVRAKRREKADRALFWAWKVNGNRKYLKRLSNSYSINIYSLAAKDVLGERYELGITPNLSKGRVRGFNIKDPIAWSRLKRKIFSRKTDLYALADRFKVSETVGIYSYIMAKASRDKSQYFPMPYREYLSKLPIKRQAIIYAIARQESKFVPASVSSSFALGMMQIMPFLVKHLAKERGELVDYDDMFDPYKALDYANRHLDYLTKWLHHPLFVAYAYNAGIGFTRKLITRGNYFHSDRNYEPWLSLERITNIQANDYGKKVLANYIIYLNKLGYHIRLTDMINSLTNINITDKFRKRRRK
jgi:soluble lytic murein transglycosylase